MTPRELTEKEKLQREMLDARLKGRKPINQDVLIVPACDENVYEGPA